MRTLLVGGLVLIALTVAGQSYSVKQHQQALAQLEALKSGQKILYVSFLPGQENTRLLISAQQKYHYTTGVFWMSRGEGMRNYNGPEKGIDLGVIHTAEMEQAAKLGGYEAFVSSCKDLGARDTAIINATLPTDRLIQDLAAVIRQFRPDIMVIGHHNDSIGITSGFNRWMDSISLTANGLASGQIKGQMDNRTRPTFSVPYIVADETPYNTSINNTSSGQRSPLASQKDDAQLRISLKGVDSVTGESFHELAARSKQTLRSVYPDTLLDIAQIPVRADEARLSLLVDGEKVIKAEDVEALKGLFATNMEGQIGTGLGDARNMGVWQRLSVAGNIPITSVQQDLKELSGSLMVNNAVAANAALRPLLLLFNTPENGPEKVKTAAINPDKRWVLSQLHSLQHLLMGVNLVAASDNELGVLGQSFRLTVSRPMNNTPMGPRTSVQWLRVPGLADTLRLDTTKKESSILVDTTLHIPLFQEAYQPFWLNKSLRADGSYNVDASMQGRLLDTSSYHVEVHTVLNRDTLVYQVPIAYRHFDRMEGEVTRPFYTIEPVLLALTPTVLLTHVMRDNERIASKDLNFNIKTLFKDSAQVAIFKLRQVGIQATINGQKIQSDSSSMVYQDAGYIVPTPGARMKVGIVFSDNMIKKLNPLTPILKPIVLFKMPEGAQGFSSNVKSIGYPYQASRIYNYHSQTLVVGDTICTSGKQLLYLNGLSGDVYENAFNQLGYGVQQSGFKDFASWASDVDLASGDIPSEISDSLRKLDAIVMTGADEVLPTDSIQKSRLRYLLAAYLKEGGRIVNLDEDPAMQELLPGNDRITSGIVVAGKGSEWTPLTDSLSGVFHQPNLVPISFFNQWEGILSRGAVEASGNSAIANGDSLTAPDWQVSSSYPIRLPQKAKNAFLAPLSIDYLSASGINKEKIVKGVLINCFIELSPWLSNGKASAYKFLANLLALPISPLQIGQK